jgi:hypothetical protein
MLFPKPLPDKSFRRGLTAMKSKNFKEACTQFSRVIESENRLKTDAHHNLAVCFLERNYYGLAAEHYQIFCYRQPKDTTPQLLEFIEVLRKGDKLPPEQGEQLVQDYLNRLRERLIFLKIGNTQISLYDFCERADDLVRHKLLEAKSPFDEISKSFSSKVPMRVYSIQALQKTDPVDAFTFCDAFTRSGMAVALVLLECAGGGTIRLKIPPYEKSHDEADLAKRCPWDWLFIRTALDQVIDTHARNFISQKPWVANSIDSIKEHLIKEFVYEGFSIGLESAGH